MSISDIREKLLRRRKNILQQREEKTSSWEELNEPEVEFEEEAAREKEARTLEQLDRQEKEEIESIDAALGKIETDGYGVCESCGERIKNSRLEAIPWTPYCVECAEKREQNLSAGPAPAVEPDRKSKGYKESRSHSDEEIREMIYDKLRTDAGVETEELDVRAQEGWVYLEGVLPSKSQHETLIGIVQDVLGFKDIVDRIQVDRQLWENRLRSRGQTKRERLEKEKRMESEGGETDVWSSIQEGESLDPPDKLTPEKKTP